MDQPIRVVAVAPYPLLHAGLGAALTAAPDLDLVAESHTVPAAVDLCDQLAPDVLVFAGHALDDGTFLSLARLYQQQVKTVLVSTHADDPIVRQARLAGVHGWVLLNEPLDHLLRAVRTVAQGGVWYSQAIAQKLHAQQNDLELHWHDLTENEQKLLRLLAKDVKNAQIAAELGIGVQTVRNYCHDLYQKLGIHSRHEAVVWLFKQRGGRYLTKPVTRKSMRILPNKVFQ